MFITIDGNRVVYVHRDKWKTLPLEARQKILSYHWLNYCIQNVFAGRQWYYGLPYGWWHGMSIIDVYEDLPNHIEDEPEWVQLIK